MMNLSNLVFINFDCSNRSKIKAIQFFCEFSDSMMVPTGIYTYPFETDLPENLPTSCEGKYGFIRYLASVNIIRPSQPVQTQTIAFTVIKPHNLNASPLFQVSTQKIDRTNTDFVCFIR